MTLADAHERFSAFGQAVSYPTMQTRLNRLVDKGLANAVTDSPSQVFGGCYGRRCGGRPGSAFAGVLGRQRLVPLVAELMNEPSLSKEELAELREMLESVEGKGGTKKFRDAET